jgi:hypothetical protein
MDTLYIHRIFCKGSIGLDSTNLNDTAWMGMHSASFA